MSIKNDLRYVRLKLLGIVNGAVTATLALGVATTFFYQEFIGSSSVATKAFLILMLLFTFIAYRSTFLKLNRPYRELQGITVVVTSYVISLLYSYLMSSRFYTEANEPTVWLGMTYVIQLAIQLEVLLVIFYNIGLVVADYTIFDVFRHSTKLAGTTDRLHTSGVNASMVIFTRLSTVVYESVWIVAWLLITWVGILIVGTLPFSSEVVFNLLGFTALTLLSFGLYYELGMAPIKTERILCRRTIGPDLLVLTAIVFNHKCMLNLTKFGWHFIKSSPIYQQGGPDIYVMSMYNVYILMQATIVVVYLLFRYAGIKDLGYGKGNKNKGLTV